MPWGDQAATDAYKAKRDAENARKLLAAQEMYSRLRNEGKSAYAAYYLTRTAIGYTLPVHPYLYTKHQGFSIEQTVIPHGPKPVFSEQNPPPPLGYVGSLNYVSACDYDIK